MPLITFQNFDIDLRLVVVGSAARLGHAQGEGGVALDEDSHHILLLDAIKQVSLRLLRFLGHGQAQAEWDNVLQDDIVLRFP
eukprot:CAMPEP_0170461666 /NCGR_PEP_ID=MMETSP0123-20130129/7480_1 /TAXON_ID=182087 /ORGANISM="Favella ehrenbergii, Strain Fehren 1" /LENGTH=81 /DNA_ID=CAMNT_0010726731 /DNA_START=297 /DNA_END=542 /DNA_ORIENTATION=+